MNHINQDATNHLRDFTDLSEKYKEIEKKTERVSNALGAISESSLLNSETKQNLRSLIRESNRSKKEFKKNLRNKRSKLRKRKYLCVIVERNTSQTGEIIHPKKNTELSPEELMKEMMCHELSKDWCLNTKLTESEKRKIAKKIMQFEKIIIRYRNYYGKNPLKWTPDERKTVSAIYIALSNEYDKLGYEEGKDKNKLISDNLLNNPLNKLKRFNVPSAPRGCVKATGPKTFSKFVDGD